MGSAHTPPFAGWKTLHPMTATPARVLQYIGIKGPHQPLDPQMSITFVVSQGSDCFSRSFALLFNQLILTRSVTVFHMQLEDHFTSDIDDIMHPIPF